MRIKSYSIQAFNFKFDIFEKPIHLEISLKRKSITVENLFALDLHP